MVFSTPSTEGHGLLSRVCVTRLVVRLLERRRESIRLCAGCCLTLKITSRGSFLEAKSLGTIVITFATLKVSHSASGFGQ